MYRNVVEQIEQSIEYPWCDVRVVIKSGKLGGGCYNHHEVFQNLKNTGPVQLLSLLLSLLILFLLLLLILHLHSPSQKLIKNISRTSKTLYHHKNK